MKYHTCKKCGKVWDCVFIREGKKCKVPKEILCAPCSSEKYGYGKVKETHYWHAKNKGQKV